MPTDITLAFAGHAPNRRSHVQSSLEDWLHLGSPDADGYYSKPDRWGAITIYALLPDGEVPKGLRHALHMAVSIGDLDSDVEVIVITDKVSGDVAEWGEAVDRVEEVADPFSYLIGRLVDSPAPHLLINWDEEDADDTALIKQAHAAGKIRVSDLAQGLSQILPDEEEEEEEEAAPEPEVEEPRPSRERAVQRPAQELEEAEEELEEVDRPAQEEPKASSSSASQHTLEEDVAAAKRTQDMQSTIAVGHVEVSSDVLRDLQVKLSRVSFYLQAQDTANAARQLDDTRWSPLTQEAMAAEEMLTALLEPSVPYATVAAPQPEVTKSKPQDRKRVVWDEDNQEWKPAGRGRTRRGVRVGWMDADGNVSEES